MSADVAARNFSFTTGCVSASSVVSHTEPHHTPCAPSASDAADLPAVADAARGEHRRRRHGVDDLGDEHHRADLAGVAAGLVALGDDDVDAGVLLALGVLRLADEAGDDHAVARAPARPCTSGGGPSALAMRRVLCANATSISGCAPLCDHDSSPTSRRQRRSACGSGGTP